MIRVLGVFVPVRFTEDDRSEPMSSQPNGAWLTQDAYDRLAKELAELEGPGRTEIAERIATVLCGGDVDRNAVVDEDWLIRLERTHFVELAQQEKTQARIGHMLKTGKPLRN